MENKQEPMVGSVEYYEHQIAETLAKAGKCLAFARELTVVTEEAAGKWPTVSIGPRDGLSDVADMFSRIGTLGAELSYYRSKVIDKQLLG